MKLLLQHNGFINDRDINGQTPFHCAAKSNSVEAMEMLLQRGASVNDKDKRGCTALHNAVSSNSLEAMQLLLQHGASVNIVNRFNQTPADIVRKGKNQRAKDILNGFLHAL